MVKKHERVMYVWKMRSERAVQSPHTFGRGFHLHYPAGGKTIISQMSDEQVREYIESTGLSRMSENTITDGHELFEELARIRDRGVAFNRGEERASVRALGTPIVYKGDVRGAFSVLGPSKRLTGSRFEETIPEFLQGATNEIELKFA